jgi:hypothetical protein
MSTRNIEIIMFLGSRERPSGKDGNPYRHLLAIAICLPDTWLYFLQLYLYIIGLPADRFVPVRFPHRQTLYSPPSFPCVLRTLPIYFFIWWRILCNVSNVYLFVKRNGSVVVKTLCYKPECRGFDTRWGDFLHLPNPSGSTRPWDLLSL